jgi:hypothetical protein
LLIKFTRERKIKMSSNRLLTSLVQLALAGVTIPLLIATIKDIKENGLFGDKNH